MDHFGEDSRDALRNSPHYEACVEFCERWDQTSFDPKFETKPLEHSLPELKDTALSPDFPPQTTNIFLIEKFFR